MHSNRIHNVAFCLDPESAYVRYCASSHVLGPSVLAAGALLDMFPLFLNPATSMAVRFLVSGACLEAHTTCVACTALRSSQAKGGTVLKLIVLPYGTSSLAAQLLTKRTHFRR